MSIPAVLVRRPDLAGQDYLVRATIDPFDRSRAILRAWTPSSIMGNHSTISTIDGSWYGLVGTERDPELYEHLPGGSEERVAAVLAQRASRAAEARAAIWAAYPRAQALEVVGAPFVCPFEAVVPAGALGPP